MTREEMRELYALTLNVPSADHQFASLVFKALKALGFDPNASASDSAPAEPEAESPDESSEDVEKPKKSKKRKR